MDWKQLLADLDGGQRSRLEQYLLAQGEQFNLFPLSFTQERLWFFVQRAGKTSMHHISGGLYLEGRLAQDALAKSLNALLDRHEVLRSTFHVIGGQPRQAIIPPGQLRLDFPVIDLQGFLPECQERELERLAINERERPFDLEQGPLIRMVRFVLNPLKSALVFTIHHLVFDGWSLNIFMQDLSTLYAAALQDRTAELPSLPIQYVDFAAWQRNLLQTYIQQESFQKWKYRLSCAETVVHLPLRAGYLQQRSFHGTTYPLFLPADLVKELRAFARREQVTLFMLILSAFQVLLYRHTSQRAFVIGTYIANRQRAEMSRMVGDCTNILPLIAEISEDEPRFRDFLRSVRDRLLEAQQFSDLPIQQLAVSVWGGQEPQVLFPVMFSFMNKDVASGIQVPDGMLSLLEIPELETIMPFDLQLRLWTGEIDITGCLEYSIDLYESEMIAGLASNFQRLLWGLLKQPDVRLSQLPLLSEEELSRRYSWTEPSDQTVRFVPLPARLVQLAREAPNAVALRDARRQLTYQQLTDMARKVAAVLSRQGLRLGQVVLLQGSVSCELLVGLFGIWITGAICAFSEEVNDATTGETVRPFDFLLTQEQVSAWCSTDVSAAGDVSGELLSSPPALIFPGTPGRTGDIDGQLISAGEFALLLSCLVERAGLESSDRCLFAGVPGDPLALSTLLLPLLAGACLCLSNDDVPLAAQLRNSDASVVLLSANRFVDLEADCFSAQRVVLVTGVRHAFPGWSHPDLESKLLLLPAGSDTPIGSFLPARQRQSRLLFPTRIGSMQTLVLSEQQTPVPVGVVGRLYLVGERVSSEDSQESMREGLFYSLSTQKGMRLSDTGLKARALSQDEIEYVGLSGGEVVMHGRRIWQSELATLLCSISGIKDAVVAWSLPGSGFPDRLVAWGVLCEGVTRAELLPTLKSSLLKELPANLRPVAFVTLSALPLTPWGCIEQIRLPAPTPGDELHYFASTRPREKLSSRKQQVLEKWMKSSGRRGRDR